MELILPPQIALNSNELFRRLRSLLPLLRSVMPSAAYASGVGPLNFMARTLPTGPNRVEGPDRRGPKTTEEEMKSQTTRATARISKNGKYLIVNSNGHTSILNANLVRYLFDIPYTRKDGTHVSTSQIFEMKQSAQVAYDQKVKEAVG